MAYHRGVIFSCIPKYMQYVLFSTHYMARAVHHMILKKPCYTKMTLVRFNVICEAKYCCKMSPKYVLFQTTINNPVRKLTSESLPPTATTSSKDFLLHALQKISDGNFSPEQYVDIFEKFASVVIRDKYMYTLDRYGVPFETTFFDDEGYVLEQVVHESEFNQLLSCFQSNIDDFEISDLAKVIYFLVHLGVPTDNIVCSQILVRLMDKKSVLSWTDLEKLGVVSAHSGNRDLFATNIIIPKMKILLESEAHVHRIQDMDEHDKRNAIISMIRVLAQSRNMIATCTDMFRKCSLYVHEHISDEWLFQNPIFILYSLRLMDIICILESTRWQNDVFVIWDAILEKIMQNLALYAETTPITMCSPILKLIRKIFLFLPDYQTFFQKHYDQIKDVYLKKCQIEIEKEDIPTYVLLSLVFPLRFCRRNHHKGQEFDRFTSKLDDLIIDQMKHLEVRKLGYLAQDYTIGRAKSSHRVIKELFDICLKNYMDIDMTKHKALFIFRCFELYHPYLQGHIQNMRSDIVKEMALSFEQYVYTNELTSKCFSRILPFCYGDVQVPEFMSEQIIRILPQLSRQNLQKIMRSLQGIPDPWFQDYLTFHGVVTKLILGKLQENPSFSSAMDVIAAIYGYGTRKLNSECPNIRTILNLLPKLVSEMNLVEFLRYFQVLVWIDHYDEKLLESLESFVLKKRMYMKSAYIANILRYMYRVGHDIRSIEFESFCMDRIEKEFDDCKNLFYQILYVYRLCQNGMFPEKLISKIFSLEFLQRIDSLMKGNTEYENIMKVLMILNRLVVIDCPQLRVPWLMETYGHLVESRKPTIKEKVNRVVMSEKRPLPEHNKFIPSVWSRTWSYRSKEVVSLQSFRAQVNNCIASILGDGFYKRNSRLPYHYLADFEIYLDGNNTPLFYEIGKESSDQTVQRIVLMLLCEGVFCFNSRKLRGSLSTKTRHLQILGFKVIHIPHYEWNSMAYSTTDSKEQYLKDKIFSNH